MRMIGLGPWEKNPKYCRGCYQDIDAHHGGAEVELSMLFADVRGSTGIAEGMSPLNYSKLLNRFYEVAADLLVDREAIVDKFVGDEVVGLFVPGMAGLDHAARAIDAARSLLVATGHGSTGGSWIPVGVGVHTGVAFVGSVGDRGVTDFTALGDAVNTAARVASMAGPGETLVTRAAAEAARLGGGGNGGTSSCADGLSPSTPWCFERERRRPNPDRGRAWLCPVTPGRRSSWA